MNWTLKQGGRDEWGNLQNVATIECLCHHPITPKPPVLRGSGANLDWIQVRLSVSGGGSRLERTRLRHFPCLTVKKQGFLAIFG